MQFLSIDLETTGLNPEKDQILEFGCIIGDLDYNTDIMELPSWQTYFYYDRIEGDPFALGMNHEILTLIAKRPTGFEFIHPDELAGQLNDFLSRKLGKYATNQDILVAGKNFDKFDRQFLNRLKRFNTYINLTKGALDPGNLYFNPLLDTKLPSLKTCCERANITPYKEHTALGDARTVVALIREYYHPTSNWTYNVGQTLKRTNKCSNI